MDDLHLFAKFLTMLNPVFPKIQVVMPRTGCCKTNNSEVGAIGLV